jgi:hypothetical protein
MQFTRVNNMLFSNGCYKFGSINTKFFELNFLIFKLFKNKLID